MGALSLCEVGRLDDTIRGMNYSKPFLGKIVNIRIDRPLGSKHPRHDYTYPVNYGFVPDTKAPDGAEIDVYVLGEDKPLDQFLGKCMFLL